MNPDLTAAYFGVAGTFVGGLVAWLVGRLHSREQVAIDMHREFSNLEFSKARQIAYYFHCDHPDKDLDALEQIDRQSANYSFLILRFFERLWILIECNEISKKLVPRLFGEVFFSWYNWHYCKAVPADWSAANRLKLLKQWFEANSPADELARWNTQRKPSAKLEAPDGEQSGEPEPPTTRALKSWLSGGGPVTAVVRPHNMFAAPPIMNLTVLRSPDIDRASEFYSEMGLLFTKHRHGSGPEHYTSCVDGFVFEIYPLGKHPPTVGTRIGFSVDDVDSIVTLLVAIGAELISPAADSEWGRRAVVRDLDGHVVELLTPPNRDKIVASDKTSTGVITVTHSDGMNPEDADRD